jgi:hypothetical protein
MRVRGSLALYGKFPFNLVFLGSLV